MPRKAPPATDWQPIDLLQLREIYASLPREKIEQEIARTFPNWETLDDGQRNAVCTVILDAFLFLIKDRKDNRGFPRVATVKNHLDRVDAALAEAVVALSGFDLRTAKVFKTAAGAEAISYNSNPLNESPMSGEPFDRGHHRVELLKRALNNARRWTADALKALPKNDPRKSAEPGLEHFAESVAHIWESYGGVRFTASRNRQRAPDFMFGILKSGGEKCSEARVLKAAQAVAGNMKRQYADRIVVAPEARSLSLAEPARRGPHPKKRKQSATG